MQWKQHLPLISMEIGHSIVLSHHQNFDIIIPKPKPQHNFTPYIPNIIAFFIYHTHADATRVATIAAFMVIQEGGRGRLVVSVAVLLMLKVEATYVDSHLLNADLWTVSRVLRGSAKGPPRIKLARVKRIQQLFIPS